MVSANARLQERLEALEDEVDLLKTEIRQTLVDMREALLKRSGVLSLAQGVEVPQETSVVEALPDSDSLSAVAPPPGALVEGVSKTQTSGTGLDLSADQGSKSVINDVLEWMGSAKERGVTSARLFPILEAYENAGMMSPLMAKFIMKNMSMLDEIEIGGNGTSISPTDYSTVLADMHKLVCISIDSSQ